MHPVLFAWRGLEVRSYTAMVYLGAVAGVFAGTVPARLRGLPPDRFLLAATAIVGLGLAGGRCWYAATRGRWTGGALNGGLLAGLALSPAVLLPLGLPLARFWDAGTVAALLGIGIGRIGCLLNGCCAGRPSRRGLILPGPDGTRRRLPTQAMESAFCLGLAAAAAMAVRLSPPGAVVLGALAALGGGRFGLEGLRARPSRASRAASALLAAAAGAGLLILLA